MDLAAGENPGNDRKTSKVGKKRRGKTTRFRQNGRLQPMLDMPLDVIIEICSHLHPKDLLNLARSSKDLRKFFMSRNSSSAWKAARATVTQPLPGLPPCPADLSEPAYANLMFDAYCHNCLKLNCQDVDVACRVRLCSACFSILNVTIDDCATFVDAAVFELISPRPIQDLVPTLENRAHHNGVMFYKPQLEDFASELMSIPASELEKYLCARETLAFMNENNNFALSKFLNRTHLARTRELENIREARKQCIYRQLREEGYGAELDWLEDRSYEKKSLEEMHEFRKNQHFTPRVWANIRGNIVNRMEEVRKKRAYANKKNMFKDRLELMKNALNPFISNRWDKEFIVGAAIFNPELYNKIRINEAEFNSKELLDSLWSATSYLFKQDQGARELFIEETRYRLGLDASVDPLKLALAERFFCSSCSMTLRLSCAPRHQCNFYKPAKPEFMDKEDYDLLVDVFRILTPSYENNHPQPIQLLLTLESTRRIEAVIVACGLDVRTATAADLDNANVKFQCLSHNSKRGPGIPIMDWRTAAQHWCSPTELSRATEQQISAADTLWEEANRVAQVQWCKDPEFACRQCRSVTGDLSTVVNHLTTSPSSHTITKVTDGLIMDMHRTVFAPLPVYLVSRKVLSPTWLRKWGDVARVRRRVNF